MSSENKKSAHLERTLGVSFIRLNELDRVSNNSIDVNFHLQKSLGIFDTNSADKIESQNYKGGKSVLSHAT